MKADCIVRYVCLVVFVEYTIRNITTYVHFDEANCSVKIYDKLLTALGGVHCEK